MFCLDDHDLEGLLPEHQKVAQEIDAVLNRMVDAHNAGKPVTWADLNRLSGFIGSFTGVAYCYALDHPTVEIPEPVFGGIPGLDQ